MKIAMDHVKPGKIGNWAVEEFVAEELWYRISMAKTGRGVPPGKYMRLTRNGSVIMSNTPDEIRGFMPFVHRASGKVLINGLGLGVVLTAILQKPEVTHITIIEQSEDVIRLIAPYFPDPRVTFIISDAYAYKPTGTFDYVWHDIWDHICADNLPQMATLHRKYAKKTKWQDSWCKRECQRLKKIYQKERYLTSF